MSRLHVYGLILVLIVATPALELGAAPALELSQAALTVRGIASGSAVALLSVAREPAYYMARVVTRKELLVDEDRDGVIRYEPPSGIAFASIWIIVELSSGDAVVGAPEGFWPVPMTQPGTRRGKAFDAIADTIEVGRDAAQVLLVRPGVGAWTMAVTDGGPLDRDEKPNGKMRLDPGMLRPLGAAASDPPRTLKHKDVIAVLDPERMEYWVSTLERGEK